MSHPTTVDPRPRVTPGPDGRYRVEGLRCPSCGEVAAFAWPCCPTCRGAVEAASFGPDGTVWSTTVVRIPVPGRTPPYVLAYVDLDDGPRVLAHVTGPAAPIGSRVRLAPPSADGDVTVEGGGVIGTVAVHGVGTSHFGRQPHRDLVALAADAVREAFADAGTDDIDAVWVGTVFGPPGVAQRVLRALGVTGIPVVTVENACASGTTAFAEAHEAVRSGRYGRVLALGLEQMSTAFAGAITPEPTDPEGRSGLALPALYAMAAARYLHLGLVTPEQLAAVSVKNHAHALHNPRAQYAGRHTVAEVLGSRMIADPLTLLQCCPTSDGAAAAVLAPALGGESEVAVRGVALRSGTPWNHRSAHVWGHDLVQRTAADAYAAAGLHAATDVDVAEVHDAFTIGEIVTTEALGLVAPGEGGKAAAAGVTALGGALPVNPSGGLLSRGHPLGATGLAQLAEIVWQLRGEAGGRQVDGARIGLVETMGGGVSVLDGNSCVVVVLEAP